jgi:hypothetical protein
MSGFQRTTELSCTKPEGDNQRLWTADLFTFVSGGQP